RDTVRAKHKFTLHPLKKDDFVYMYGVKVGLVNKDMEAGEAITIENTLHATDPYQLGERKTAWIQPDVSAFKSRTFAGYHRSNGSVGTANHWVVIPMVFCENRNVLTLKEALVDKLGYKVQKSDYSDEVDALIQSVKSGYTSEQIIDQDLSLGRSVEKKKRL